MAVNSPPPSPHGRNTTVNLDDLRTVNVFLGIEPDATGKYDANWIFRTLIPALEGELKSVKWYPALRNVTLVVNRKEYIGLAPTFEAAMISAAAKAVRSV